MNKTNRLLSIVILNLLLSTVTALKAQHSHEKEGQANHSHAGKESHAGHSHEVKVAGPNGGRIIDSAELRFEFFVREDRKVQITILDEKNKPLAPKTQEFSAVTGDRSSQTQLTFSVQEGVLLSNQALPEGNYLPIILTFKNTPESKAKRERFTINLDACSVCIYREYACICEH